MEEDQRPRRAIVHEIGHNVDDLSVHELEERVALLQTEIDRLQAARTRKQQALNAAGSIFGRRES